MPMFLYGYESSMMAQSVFFGWFWFFLLLIPVFSIVAYWKLFQRAGITPWFALIPFVSSYHRYEMTFGKGRGWFFVIGIVTGGLFDLYQLFMEARAFGMSDLFGIAHAVAAPFTGLVMAFGDHDYAGPQRFFLDK